MYRKRKRISEKIQEAMQRGRERARMSRPPQERPPELPDLRREIIIRDYDFGLVEHHIRLYRTNRVDCYRAETDKGIWKRRIGWAKVLEGVRKSFVRVGACGSH